MKLSIVILFACLDGAIGQQALTFSYTEAGGLTTFAFGVYENGDAVTVVQVLGATDTPVLTMSLSGGLTGFQFTYNPAGNALTAIVPSGTGTTTLTPIILGASSQFIGFRVRALASASSTTATDAEYQISNEGGSPGTTSFPTPTLLNGPTQTEITLTPTPAPSVTLDVVNPTTDASETQLELTASYKLKFTLTSTNWYPKAVIAGAVLHSCVASNNNGFTGSGASNSDANKAVTFIDSNGCCIATSGYLDNSCPSTSGFTRSSTSTEAIGGTKVYVAYTSTLEVVGFFDEVDNSYDPRNEVYIKCNLNLCYDDTTGECAGLHCDTTGRRKRSVHDNSTTSSVMTKVTINNTKQKKTECCSQTTLFTGTIAALGSLTAIMFGVMIMVFLDTNRKVRTPSRSSYSAGQTSSKGSTFTSQLSAATKSSRN